MRYENLYVFWVSAIGSLRPVFRRKIPHAFVSVVDDPQAVVIDDERKLASASFCLRSPGVVREQLRC